LFGFFASANFQESVMNPGSSKIGTDHVGLTLWSNCDFDVSGSLTEARCSKRVNESHFFDLEILVDILDQEIADTFLWG